MTLHDQLKADGWTKEGGATWTRGHLRIAPAPSPIRTGATLHRRGGLSMTAYAPTYDMAIRDLIESVYYGEALAEPEVQP